MLKTIPALTCFLLSACMMVGPDYRDPKASLAQHWLKNNNSVKETPFKHAEWWKIFHDPVLTTLINQGYHNNLNLQIAGVRVLQARAQLAQSTGQLYPQQQAALGNYTYNRIGGGSLETLLPSSFDTALLGFTANWELDFWGKYRRAIQANDAAFLASLAAYDNTLVTLTADIASNYINIRMNQAQIKVTRENIRIQKMGLKIALSRFQAGETSLLDVEQAKTELAQTEATLPGLVSKLQSQKDTLALLLGLLPNQIDPLLVKSRGIPKAPESVAVGIPRETLARRPDIHEARLEAMTQSANIGAIKAQLYPAFSLSGTFAFAANNIPPSSISDLFNWSSRTITAGPGFNWSLLNYGQITNAVRAQDAVFQQALLKYMNLVLQAQQEVQDNITRFIEAKKAGKYLAAADRSAIKSTKLSFIRYKEGETNFTTVLNSEQQQLKVQTSLVNAEAEIPLALVALYRALGGGWQLRKGNDIVPDAIKAEMAARTNWGSLLQQQNHSPPLKASEHIKQLYLPKW